MRLIRNDCTDPAFNLAAEEYLLTTTKDSLCMLWRNEKAVIVGKNQDTLAEIDQAFVERQGIKVVRRITGGGAVFHDLGNVNFTLIEPESGHFDDYAYFTADLIAFLATLGVWAEQNDRNDVLIGERKICGNAQCVKDGMVMHHGCILYDTNLAMLTRALKPSPEKLRSKGIASVASRVTNIREHMTISMDTTAFMDAFARFITERHGCVECALTGAEQIQKLADEKYSAWEWNYG